MEVHDDQLVSHSQTTIPDLVGALVSDHENAYGGLISILEEIQRQFGYLPKEALEAVAEELGRPLVDVYGVASFYKSFSMEPRGKHTVCVCMGTACHVRGAPMIVEEFERRLDIKSGETTPDRDMTLETAACLGACALGPIVVADGRYEANVTTVRVKKILKRTLQGGGEPDVHKDKRIFSVDVSCPRCNHLLMDPSYEIDGQPSIRVTIAFGERHGWLRMSSLYGSYNLESEYEVPHNAVAHFFCPHCHAEIKGATHCSDCSAPMVSMIVRAGGTVHICSRRGCRGHMLDLSGVNF